MKPMWTYSIEFEYNTEEGVKYGSTMVSADDARKAVELFFGNNQGADIREMRRVRHD